MKKGVCQNIGACSLANSQEQQEFIDDSLPFICSECGQTLQEVNEDVIKSPFLWKKILAGVAAVIVVAGLITWLGISFFSKGDKQIIESDNKEQTEESVVTNEPEAVSEIQDSEETEIETPIDNIKEELETQLFSIGNSKQQMEDRIAAIEPTLKEFFSSAETPKVKVLGKQGTVVEIKDAESYLKWLAGIVTLKGLKVHDVEYDSDGKVRLLEVEEIHDTN